MRTGAFALFVVLCLPGVASAATFNVTKTADTLDGACTSADCSLREAVFAANASAGADVIVLPAGTYALTRTGRNEDFARLGDLDVRGALTVVGAGSAATHIDGGEIDRVLDVSSGTLVLRDLTVERGRIQGQSGGGIRVSLGGSLVCERVILERNIVEQPTERIWAYGGAIWAAGNVTLLASIVRYNASYGDGPTGSARSAGGGVSIVGTSTRPRFTLIVSDCTFLQNRAGYGGAIAEHGYVDLIDVRRSVFDTNKSSSNGGAIHSWTDVRVSRSRFTNNWADGTAGAVHSRLLVADETTFELNHAAGNGGAVVMIEGDIIASTFSRNDTQGDGGAIFTNADARLINSTFSNNYARRRGGAVHLNAGDAGVYLDVFHSTFIDNRSESWGSAIMAPGAAPVRVTNVILQRNSLAGWIESGGTNFSDVLYVGVGGLWVLGDAQLGPLADNGGRTQTHMPSSVSPAVDSAPAGACPSTDQRGVSRPRDGNLDGISACDFGAVERRRVEGLIIYDPGPGVGVLAD